MKRNSFALVALVALVIPGATAEAQIGYGAAVGFSTPQGDFANLVEAGLHATGSVIFSPPLAPIGFRGEVSVSQFNYKGTLAGAKARIYSAAANVVIASPGIIGPYLIGGFGIYNASSVCDGCTTKSTKGGVNAGGGFKFGVGGYEAFLEARYHYIPGAMDPTTAGIKSSTRFIPVSFGLKF